MAVGIYLSNNIIRAVTGAKGKDKIKIEKQFIKEIPEGSLINGVITNGQELEGELAAFFDENKLSKKEVYLVVHSSKFVSKQIALPKVKKAQTEKMVTMEFSDVERYEDAVYDYTLMPKQGKGSKNMQELLGVMAERTFIEEYVKVFEKIDVKLAGFSNAITSVVSTFARIKELRGKTCIIHVLDGNNMESVIWVNGEFRQSTNRRLFNQRGTVDFGMEIIRHTSTSLQFYESLKLSEKLEQVYLCGMKQEEIADLAEISQEAGLNLRLLPLRMEKDFPGLKEQTYISDFVYPIGALIREAKSIDFLKIYKRDNAAKEKNKGIRKMLMPVFIMLAISIIASVASGLYYTSKKAQLAKIEDYLNDPVNVQRIKEADDWRIAYEKNNQIIKDIKDTIVMTDSYPLINDHLVQTISGANSGGVTGTILSYQSETGNLTMEAKADQVTAINGYVSALKNTGMFETVEYTGYTFNSTDNYYSVSVIGHLTQDAGR